MRALLLSCLCACGAPIAVPTPEAPPEQVVVFDGSLGKELFFQPAQVVGHVVAVRGELRNRAGNGDYNRTQVVLMFFDDTGDAMGGVLLADVPAQLAPGQWQSLDADVEIPPLRAAPRTAQLMLTPLYAAGQHLADVRLSAGLP